VKFLYSGSSFVDVKSRIALARMQPTRERILTKKENDEDPNMAPVLLYGCEIWTYMEEELDKLRSFKTWLQMHSYSQNIGGLRFMDQAM